MQSEKCKLTLKTQSFPRDLKKSSLDILNMTSYLRNWSQNYGKLSILEKMCTNIAGTCQERAGN